MSGDTVLGLLAALLPGATALHHAFDRSAPRRWRSVAFWGAFAVTLAAGPVLPSLLDGVLVLLMVALATIGLRPDPVATTSDARRARSARRFGAWLFLPALCVPVLTLCGAFVLPLLRLHGRPVFARHDATLFALAIALGLALVLTLALFRPERGAVAAEARRLVDAYGWAMVLPQLLAALGSIFAIAGVGTVIAGAAERIVPSGSPLVATMMFAIGMALLTTLIGNAFTAFPILMGGIGIPILVRRFGGDPAVVAALGMLCGFCGTLLSPMAATFNLVPVAVLNLRDRYAVIRAQRPTALILLAVNTLIILACAFPGGLSGASP